MFLALVILVLTGSAYYLIGKSFPVWNVNDRMAEAAQAVFGHRPDPFWMTLLLAFIALVVCVIVYLREQRYLFEGASRLKALVKNLPANFIAFVVLNALVYLAVWVTKDGVSTGFSRTFGFHDLPLLVIDPMLGLMTYTAFRAVFWNVDPPRDRLDVGNEVVRDETEAMLAYRRKMEALQANGLLIHPEVRIPLALETRHLLLVSAPGGGKTQVMFPMLADILSRRWPALVYDFKGDYTEAYGEDEGTLILSPFDARGAAWDIARDIDTPMRALEFAACLFPHHKSDQPFFPRAAQDLLTGVVMKLQRERPGSWGFRELVAVLETRDGVVTACQQYRPAALTALGELKDRQAAGVFGELRTGTIQLEYLAQAWGGSASAGARERARFSVREWLTDDAQQAARRLVILKGSQQYRELDGFFTALIVNLVVKEVLSLPDSYERQVWAFLDEFGNLPRIEGIDKLLTAVRSKGLRVVAAIQDIAQIEEAYSRPFAQTFFGAFGTVLAGLASGDTAAFLSRAFGQNRTLRTVSSKTTTWESESTTDAETVVVENALLDSEFSGLEPPRPGVPARFWLKTAGWPIGQLLYPVQSTPKRYAASVENAQLHATAPVALRAGAVTSAAADVEPTRASRLPLLKINLDADP